MDALANLLLPIAKFTGCKTKFIFSPDRELTQCFFLLICVFSQILQWKQQMLPHHPTLTFFLLFCKITKSTEALVALFFRHTASNTLIKSSKPGSMVNKEVATNPYCAPCSTMKWQITAAPYYFFFHH